MTSRAEKFDQLASARVGELGSIDESAFAASFELFRLATRYLSHLEGEIHRPIGLSVAGFRVLFTVWLFGEMEPRELADVAGVSRAAVSGVLNTLDRDGHVHRTRESRDRRLVTVRITDEGLAILKTAYTAQNSFEQAFFSDLAAEEVQTLTALLRRLLHSRQWHQS